MGFISPYRMFPALRMQQDAAMGSLPISYTDKVMSYNPIAYWILGEAAGAAAVCQVNSPAQDGTYVGVTLGQPGIGDGNTAPFFDGALDFVNLTTAAFKAAFSDAEGTAMIWAKVFNAGVWTDGIKRLAFYTVEFGATQMQVAKLVAVNELEFFSSSLAGGSAQNTLAIGGDVGWHTLAFTWSQTANQVRRFLDGVELGVPDVWSNWGPDTFINASIGGTVGAGVLWHGWLAHYFALGYAATPAQIADLAVV